MDSTLRVQTVQSRITLSSRPFWMRISWVANSIVIYYYYVTCKLHILYITKIYYWRSRPEGTPTWGPGGGVSPIGSIYF